MKYLDNINFTFFGLLLKSIPKLVYFSTYFLSLCMLLIAFYTITPQQYNSKLSQADKTHQNHKSINSFYFARVKNMERSLNYKNLCLKNQKQSRDLMIDLKIKSYYDRSGESTGSNFPITTWFGNPMHKSNIWIFPVYRTI